VLYVVNPYVTVYLGRTSVALLAHAALPWLLLLVHRGLREPRSWRWPAAFALVLASTGGGRERRHDGLGARRAALLVLYELGPGGRGAARAGPLGRADGRHGARRAGVVDRAGARGGGVRHRGSWPSRSSPGRSGGPRR
jgi:hypothetical protein